MHFASKEEKQSTLYFTYQDCNSVAPGKGIFEVSVGRAPISQKPTT